MQMPNIAYSHLSPNFIPNIQNDASPDTQSDFTNIPGLQSMVPYSLFNQPTPTPTPNNEEDTNG